MRPKLTLIVLAALLAGCVSIPPATGALPAYPIETPTAAVNAYPAPGSTSSSGAAYPAPVQSTPQPYNAYPPPASGTQAPSAWIGQSSLVLQNGDLDTGIIAATPDTGIPDWAGKYALPQAASFSTLKVKNVNTPYGSTQLLYYSDPNQAADVYRRLVDSESYTRQALPQPDLGEQGVLFDAATNNTGATVLFKQCHTVAWIRLMETNSAVTRAYAYRLAERIRAVDCLGSERIPLSPPAQPAPAPTPTLQTSIDSTTSASIQRLPDPGGEGIIRAYTFIDANHGWLALGVQIKETKDGGLTWIDRVKATSQVKGIHFNDAQNGYIAIQNGYLVTADSGVTWSPSNTTPGGPSTPMTPPALVQKEIGLTSYAFCSENTPIAGIFTALNDQAGWAFCTSSPGDHFSFRKLYATRDGGKNWNLLNSNPPYGRYGASNMQFIDEAHGWLAASGALYSTTDGGVTWQTVTAVKISTGESQYQNVQFLDLQHGFVVTNDENFNNGLNAVIATSDGGKTWSMIYAAPPVPRFPSGPMQFFGGGLGVGGDYQFLTTADNGKTWQMVHPLANFCGQTGVSVTSLSFIDPQLGWMTLNCSGKAQPVVLRTSDGGKNWTTYTVKLNENDGVSTVAFVDAAVGYAVTQSGLLLRSDDGGANFSPVDKRQAHTSVMAFSSRDFGWELYGATLLVTRDAGITWSTLPLDRSPQSAALFADGRAWVLTGSPQAAIEEQMPLSLLISRDGGRTWSEIRLGNLPIDWRQPWLDHLQVLDADHIWLLTGSVLLYSENGGKNWVQLH